MNSTITPNSGYNTPPRFYQQQEPELSKQLSVHFPNSESIRQNSQRIKPIPLPLHPETMPLTSSESMETLRPDNVPRKSILPSIKKRLEKDLQYRKQLLVLNLFLLFISVGITAFGLANCLKLYSLSLIILKISDYSGFGSLMTGIPLFVASTLAIYAVYSRKRTFLILYQSCLALVFILVVFYGFSGYQVYASTPVSSLNNPWRYFEPAAKQSMQTSFKCCGGLSSSDSPLLTSTCSVNSSLGGCMQYYSNMRDVYGLVIMIVSFTSTPMVLLSIAFTLFNW